MQVIWAVNSGDMMIPVLLVIIPSRFVAIDTSQFLVLLP